MVPAPRNSGATVSFGLNELPSIQRTVKRMGLPQQRAALTKLLVNVTVEGTLGPIHVVISPEDAVADLIRAAVEEYVKEERRPLLRFTDPKEFELHYSQYSLESLDPQEKLINLGSRNFFLCSSSSEAQALAGNCYNQETDSVADIPPLL